MNELCEARCAESGWYCTREKDHAGPHVATKGRYAFDAPRLATWTDDRSLRPAAQLRESAWRA